MTGTGASRKLDHVRLALGDAATSTADAGWDDVRLVPRAVPECSLDDVDLTTTLVGRQLAAPLVLAGMTGGHPDVAHLNATLGAAAQSLGLAVGVGSQRAALADPSLAPTFAAVRDHAPDAVVLANLGAVQLVAQGDRPAVAPDRLADLVAMVRADALALHLNVAQELVQPEGDRVTGPLLDAIAAAVAACPVPVVAKETGCGITAEDAAALVAAGVAALDVGGAGGTSFPRIEGMRGTDAGDVRAERLGHTFAGWGVPTAASVLECATAGVPVIATGGVRTGLDVARALALGAHAAGVGRVAVRAAQDGPDALLAELGHLLAELRAALVLCGATTPDEMRARGRQAVVLTGDTLAWATQRGWR